MPWKRHQPVTGSVCDVGTTQTPARERQKASEAGAQLSPSLLVPGRSQTRFRGLVAVMQSNPVKPRERNERVCAPAASYQARMFSQCDMKPLSRFAAWLSWVWR